MAQRSSEAPFPPGPRIGLKDALSGLGSPQHTLDLLVESAREYGPIVGIKALGGKGFLLDHPDYIRYVLAENQRNYVKSKNYEALELVIGNGLLTNEGDHWQQQRRLMQPPFHSQRIQQYGDLICHEAEAKAADWETRFVQTDGICDLSREMTELTLRVVSKALFGASVQTEMDKLIRAQNFLNGYVDSRMGGVNVPHSIPTPKNRRYHKSLQDLDEVVWGIIRERRNNPDSGDDLLSMLLDARDERTGEAMNERQLRDEVATILLAGNETTANALSWTWYLLHKHPEVEHEFHRELDQVLAGREPSLKDLKSLPYTEMIFQESMRLFPPAWAISRKPVADDEIASYPIPAGSTVLICPYVTHRNPEYWDDSDSFKPERFAHGTPNDYSYFPFGGGPRKCLGNGFAMMEGQLILATLAQHFSIRILNERDIKLNPQVTLRPRNGMKAAITRRHEQCDY